MRILSFVPRIDVQRRIARALNAAGVFVDTVESAEECLLIAGLAEYTGVLVDSDSLMFEAVILVVRQVRQQNPYATIFVLSRYLELEQRLRLFESGLDDCVHEPFFASELAVRFRLSIRLRRRALDLSRSTVILRSCDFELDLIRRTVSRSGQPIRLRPKEFLLLKYLMNNANRPVTRKTLLHDVWKYSDDAVVNVVDVCVSALRAKIDQNYACKLIQTNRGIGYTFACLEHGDAGNRDN